MTKENVDKLQQALSKATLERSRAETKKLEAWAKYEQMEKAYGAAYEKERMAFSAWRAAIDEERDL